MPKKRGNPEGPITPRKEGRWMAQLTIGRDPTADKRKRVSLYGRTWQDVTTQLAHALHDYDRGMLVAPHRLTVSKSTNAPMLDPSPRMAMKSWSVIISTLPLDI